MSSAEIADNKWELDASKPQIMTPGSLAQIIMMGGFGLFFAYILVFSVIGMFSEKTESDIGGRIGHMDDTKAEAPPAE